MLSCAARDGVMGIISTPIDGCCTACITCGETEGRGKGVSGR